MDKFYSIVFVTVPNIDDGQKIARILVGQKLAACVNILPGITSIYTWEDEICEDREALLIIKTRAELFDALSAVVREEHPYEVPEVIAVPFESGIPDYLGWIDKVTQRL